MARDTSNITWADWFYYDETSPSCLRWKVNRSGGNGSILKYAGETAGGFCNTNLKWAVSLHNETYKVHRVIWELFNCSIETSMVIDHIDGNAGNNIITNLRLADVKTNNRNVKKYRNNRSGTTGVRFTTAIKPSGKIYEYAEVDWVELDGTYKNKRFSVLKLGHEEAWRLATELRISAIEKLNNDGAGYTQRHGT